MKKTLDKVIVWGYNTHVMSRYEQVKDNEWTRPIRRGYRARCCDCGLVHQVDFRIVREGRVRRIELRARRDNRATGQSRRWRKENS